MTLSDLVSCEAVYFPKDRSELPKPITVYEDGEWKDRAVLYEDIDFLVKEGWAVIRDAYFDSEKSVVYATYEGKRKNLELKGFDFESYNGNCCDKAIPVFCVCLSSSQCPEHGRRCIGSHD